MKLRMKKYGITDANLVKNYRATILENQSHVFTMELNNILLEKFPTTFTAENFAKAGIVNCIDTLDEQLHEHVHMLDCKDASALKSWWSSENE